MTQRTNEFGQPIGDDVVGWNDARPPPRTPMADAYCRIELLDAGRHLQDLFEAFSADDGRMWTYMPDGPFATADELRAWMARACERDDPLFHALIDAKTGKALGIAAYMRIKPASGVIEVGNIAYAPAMQRTPMATEAMYLMMKRAFDELGYRRYEWKCDSLNAASRRAAQRLGFSYDGLFEQAVIYKGRNRDTAWYSIIDRDWPRIRSAFESWLADDNFDDQGRQKSALEQLRGQFT